MLTEVGETRAGSNTFRLSISNTVVVCARLLKLCYIVPVCLLKTENLNIQHNHRLGELKDKSVIYIYWNKSYILTMVYHRRSRKHVKLKYFTDMNATTRSH